MLRTYSELDMYVQACRVTGNEESVTGRCGIQDLESLTRIPAVCEPLYRMSPFHLGVPR